MAAWCEIEQRVDVRGCDWRRRDIKREREREIERERECGRASGRGGRDGIIRTSRCNEKI
jgi:hypothetical protein